MLLHFEAARSYLMVVLCKEPLKTSVLHQHTKTCRDTAESCVLMACNSYLPSIDLVCISYLLAVVQGSKFTFCLKTDFTGRSCPLANPAALEVCKMEIWFTTTWRKALKPTWKAPMV